MKITAFDLSVLRVPYRVPVGLLISLCVPYIVLT